MNILKLVKDLPDVKNCPFCNGPAKVNAWEDFSCPLVYSRVECLNCFSHGPLVEAKLEYHFDNKDISTEHILVSIEKWNYRPDISTNYTQHEVDVYNECVNMAYYDDYIVVENISENLKSFDPLLHIGIINSLELKGRLVHINDKFCPQAKYKVRVINDLMTAPTFMTYGGISKEYSKSSSEVFDIRPEDYHIDVNSQHLLK